MRVGRYTMWSCHFQAQLKDEMKEKGVEKEASSDI